MIKGIGHCAGLDVVEVEGATGTVHTNFDGKAKAATDALKNGADFVYVHLEAADEAGHRHEIDNKVKSIELIDEKIVKPIVDMLKESGEDYHILLMPDHPTPLNIMTHTSDPVPYILYKSEANPIRALRHITKRPRQRQTGTAREVITLISKLLS